MRVKLILTYDGTDFSGWQVQPQKRTVQQTVEDCIFELTKERVRVTASGRTDAGVHAIAQVAHFDTCASIPPKKFKEALNIILPPDVKVVESVGVEEGFDARRDAKKKTYAYHLYQNRAELPLKNRYSVRVTPNLDIKKMQSACKIFMGEHDFKCFLASGSSVLSSIRTVYNLEVIDCGEDLTVRVTGNGFLYNMVRIIVGTLIKVGRGDLDENDLVKMLKTGDRSMGGKTVPARGLVLESVVYD